MKEGIFMFVFNLSLNKNKISKIILVISCILVLFILIFACIKIFGNNTTFNVGRDVLELMINSNLLMLLN